MRKVLFIVIIFFFCLPTYSQNNQTYTFNLNNATLLNAIETVEKNSGYKFYFEDNWVNKSEIIITATYQSNSIDDILKDIFNATDLNYFIQNQRIILTKNKVIRATLAADFFGVNDSISGNQNKITTIQNQPIVTSNTSNDATTTYIGKEVIGDVEKLKTLSGNIKDFKTNASVPNVVIRVRNSAISTVTNADGSYLFKVPVGESILDIESFNYKKISKKIVVYNNGSLDISISEDINLLNEVVVNAKKNEKIKSTKTGVTSIDIEAIKNIPLVLGERDIFKVATTLPGIKTTGEGSAGFNVRGGKEDQNLVLLDNALIYNPSHFFGFFSAVNPFATQKADIYKGSIPAEFGGRLSSVFDITSKNGSTTKISGEGGIGPITSNLTVGLPIVKDKSSLLIGVRATYSDWVLQSLKEESLKNSKASFYDGILKYSHKINEKNSIETTAYLSHDAFSISSDSLYRYSNKLAAVKWNHTYSGALKSELIVTGSEYKFNIDYDSNNENAFDFGYKINETQAQLKFNHTLNEKNKLTYGLSTKLYGIDPGYITPKKSESLIIPLQIEKERGLESALYISDNFKLNKKILFDVGLRYSTFSALGSSSQRIYQAGVPKNDGTVIAVKNFDKNEIITTYGGLEPRIAARYILAEDLSLKISYDKTYQYIHLLSSNTTQSPTDTWKLSDLNVKPQVAQQFSAGLFKNINKYDLELSLEGYYKKSNNFLDYKVGAELLLNENIETELLQGEGKAYGVEFLLKKTNGKLNGWIGYTYSRTFVKLDSQFNDERVNNGKFFAANFDKPHDVSIVLNYKFTKRYSFSTNMVYQTGRPITFPVGKYTYGNAEYTLYSDRNKFRIPDYFRLDVGLNIEGNHKIKKLAHSFWNISIYNLLGRNNPYSIYFVTDNGEIKAYKTSIFAMPIPTITYNFKF